MSDEIRRLLQMLLVKHALAITGENHNENQHYWFVIDSLYVSSEDAFRPNKVALWWKELLVVSYKGSADLTPEGPKNTCFWLVPVRTACHTYTFNNVMGERRYGPRTESPLSGDF